MALPVVNSPGAHGPVFKGSPKPLKPKAPKVTMPRPAAPKPPTPVEEAMQAYRTAIASLNGAVAPVNSAAIAAPYQQAIQTTGQLGVGYGQAMQQSGDQASQQYTQGLNEAQRAAAAFGISAGAGADPTLLQNRGTAPIAAQTQASTSAAAAGTNQWQQLLNQAQAAKISDATTARQGALDTAQASLATSLPGLIGDAKNRAFQAKTEKFNEGLASSQLDAKQNADLRDYLLGVGKLKLDKTKFDTTTGLNRDKLNEKTITDSERNRISRDSLALKKRAAAASATGLKGVAAVAKALATTTSTKPGTKKVAKGWDVQVVSFDKDANSTGTDIKTIHVPDKRHAPAGYKLVPGTSATTHYEDVPTSGGSAALTAGQWDTYMRSLLAQNPGRAAEVKRFLGPRPKK